jgi:hypothetical protein
MSDKKLKDILLALNSTGSMGFKYPIGNKELTTQVRELESQGVLWYDALYSKWVKKGKGINPRK